MKFIGRCARLIKHRAVQVLNTRTHGRESILLEVDQVSVRVATSSPLAKSFFRPGNPHESPVLSLLLRKCSSTSCFLDIGAFLGIYTLFAAKVCVEGSVHAFEMDPILVGDIQHNLEVNGLNNARVICAAVWEADGRILSFEPYVKGAKGTNVVRESELRAPLGIPSLRIDTYCRQFGLRPDLAKIDVEGAEVKVLRGMLETLQGIRILFLEVHPLQLAEFGHSMSELDDILRQAGFSTTLLKGHRGTKGVGIRHGPVGFVELDNVATVTENAMIVCEKR